jgi:predicted AAA+ superfamily ATPase
MLRNMVGAMPLPRALSASLAAHFASHRQMAFVSGPRQVGKTTICRGLSPDAAYFDWDDEDARRVVLRGPAAVAEAAGLARVRDTPRVVVFDELHKFRRWKAFLKGFFDVHGHACRIAVTASSRLDVYRRGGDSLMGRYFLFRMHPLGVGEVACPESRDVLTTAPSPVSDADWDSLRLHGGFPEPFVRRDARFSTRWRGLRHQQLVREDVRDLTQVQVLDQLDVLVRLLEAGSAAQMSYSSLATQVRVTVDTIRRWLVLLEALHAGLRVRPWFRNVARSLRKEPKWYVRDWSNVEDPGARAETLVACHLLKAVETWEDAGLGRFELRYLRDKEQNEVDFVVVRDGRPWFLAEVKLSDDRLSPALARFQRQTGAKHAFQVVVDAPFVAADPFGRRDPCVVPARTLLSQLP